MTTWPALTEAQRIAIGHPARTLQILACAGSGKTEVLARRAVRLLVEGVDPASVIAFTFTEKAAAELKARIEARAAEADERFKELPPVGRGMFIGTTHSWALQALRQLGGNYEMLDGVTEEQEWVLVYRVARRLGIVDLYAALEQEETARVATAPAVDVFLRSAEVVHNERLNRQVLTEQAPAFAVVLERYEGLLRDMRLTPFRLMIGNAADELRDGGRLRARLQGRLSHVFVDEFQDFNPAQDELLRRLADLGAAITVVADDDQAIYQWRGGDVSLFVRFRERYERSERADLAENHRCRPEIVGFARQVVDRLDGRLTKVLESARHPAPAGALEIMVASTAADEARAIGERIQRLISQGHQPSDIAVLYRSVRTSAPPLLEDLRGREVRCAVVGKTSLLAQPEMALVARIFVWWAGGTWYPNPEFEPEVVTRASIAEEVRRVTGLDADAVERRMRSIELLGERVRQEGVADGVVLFNEILITLGLPGSGDTAASHELRLGRMSELLTEFDHAVRRAVPATLYQQTAGATLDEAEEDAALAANRPPEMQRRTLGSTRGEIYLVRLRAFLEEFAGRGVEETPDTVVGSADAVQVMTVHQAKGLEFPIVFVPAVVEGRFPSARMGQRQAWLVPEALFDRQRYEGREEDEARLMYVALTRPRELLVLSWFERHKARRARVSRFIEWCLKDASAHACRFDSVSLEPVAPGLVRDVRTFDFSMLVTYRECGQRYWLRYVCGFQPPLVPELGFGKLLHHIVAELARKGARGELPREADVDSTLDEAFYLPFAGPIPAAKLREAARRRARTYVRHHGHELTRTLQPEAAFEVPLANGRLRGRIDLLLRAEGGTPNQVELIDFKTSSNRPPSEIHINQLRLYAAAAERLGLEPLKLAIHDLDADRGDRQLVVNDVRQRERFKQTLEGWVEGIRTGRFTPPRSEKICFACDYRRFCRHAPPAAREISSARAR